MDDPDGIFLCVLGLSVPVPFAVLCTALCLLIGLALGSFHFFTPLTPLLSPFTVPFTGGMAQPLSDDPAIPLRHRSPPRLFYSPLLMFDFESTASALACVCFLLLMVAANSEMKFTANELMIFIVLPTSK